MAKIIMKQNTYTNSTNDSVQVLPRKKEVAQGESVSKWLFHLQNFQRRDSFF